MSQRRTLLWRLGAVLMVVQTIVTAALGVYTFRQIRHFHHEQSLDELRRLTPLIVDALDDALASDDRTLSSRVRAARRPPGVRLTVIAGDGRVRADTQLDATTMDNHRYRPEIDAALQTGEGSSTRHSASAGMDMIYFAMRVNDTSSAVVRTSRARSEVDRQLVGIGRLLGGAVLVSLLVTLSVIYVVSRRMSRTVAEMARTAERFADGQFAPPVARPPVHELAVLADALNHMARQLSTRIGELQTQRAEQRTILQSMSNGMIALGLDQRVLSINRAAEEILDVLGSPSRGRLLQEVAREPDLNRFVGTAVESVAPTSDELRLQARGGTTIEAISQPLRNEQQDRIGVLLLIDDVTQLRRLERIRQDFAANVSHELRTPITKIKGYAETMLEVGCGDEQQTREFLDVIRRSADRLEAIIEDLLALAELEPTGATDRHTMEEIFAASIVDAAVAQAIPAAIEKQITITSDTDSDLRFHGSARLIEQALGNLLTNAINYSGTGTSVHVTARSADDGTMIVFAVADEGPGIAAAHLPRLFERFYRVDPARSRTLGGTGLGLAITKHIAIAHGGRTEVDSELGRGSTFRLVLPRAERTA